MRLVPLVEIYTQPDRSARPERDSKRGRSPMIPLVNRLPISSTSSSSLLSLFGKEK